MDDALPFGDLQAVLDGATFAGQILSIQLPAEYQRRQLGTLDQRRQLRDRARHLEIARHSSATSLVFSHLTQPSKIMISASGSSKSGLPMWYVGANSSLLVMLAGAPAVTLRGLHLQGLGEDRTEGAPAIDVHASSLTIENCILSGHVAAALRVSDGAHVSIINSSFTNNGILSRHQGGAMHVSALAKVEIMRSTFTYNSARVGGAIYASLAQVDVQQTTFVGNHGGEFGGAIFAVASRLVLGNATSLAMNVAGQGGEGLRLVRSTAWYIMPAPLGHHVRNPVLCTGPPNCDHLHNGMHVKALAGDLATFPPQCPSGFLGQSYKVADQSSPRCSGLCPAGKYCVAGTSAPKPCTSGSYCMEGSPLPVPCKPGSFTEATNLTSQDECTICSRGAWCSGGLRIPCSLGTFNPDEGSSTSTACISCPSEYFTTDASGATQLEQCKCLSGFVLEFGNGSATCARCPPGATCNDIGTTLESLSVLPGFYRPSSDSLDVRKCDDSLSNCTNAACPESTSGCRGGSSQLTSCAPTLMGPFCALCNSSVDVLSDGSSHSGNLFYVSAANGIDSSALAHCEDCRATALVGVILIGAVSVAMILVPSILSTMRQCCHTDSGTSSTSGCTGHLVTFALTASTGEVKQVVAFLLIATAVGSVYEIELPQQTNAILNALRFPLTLGLDSIMNGSVFQCLGVSGYSARAACWTFLPPYIYMLIICGVALHACIANEPISRQRLMERSAGQIFRVLFLLYPTLIRTGFSPFSCHTFEDGPSWMRADLSVLCHSRKHHRAMNWGRIMIVVYAVGIPLSFTLILARVFRVRVELQHGWLLRVRGTRARQDRLSRAVALIYRDYKPACSYWLVVEKFQQMTLVGAMQLVWPGSLTQIALALLYSILHTFFLLRVWPFKSHRHNNIAAAANISLVGLLFCASFLRVVALTELPTIKVHMSNEQVTAFQVPANILSFITLGCVLGVVIILGGVSLLQIAEEAQVVTRLALARSSRRLRYINTDREVLAPAVPHTEFHAFLSHVWGSAQGTLLRPYFAFVVAPSCPMG